MELGIKAPAVAGTFYPGDALALTETVDAMLVAARTRRRTTEVPKALIVPHAGYVYSGPIAASGYAHLAPLRGEVKRVVLLGPAHRVRMRGLASPGARALRTPLGDVPVDVDALRTIEEQLFVAPNLVAHAREHSLEVHLPFLQRVLGTFEVVPLAVGDAEPEEVAAVLDALWGGPETRIVVSSDLSHFLPYPMAKSADEETAKAIEAYQFVAADQACGARPVNGLLEVARARGLRMERLDLRTSGDTAGGKEEVVGYGAWAVFEPSPRGGAS